MKKTRIVIIRVYGKCGLKRGIKDALNMRRLYKKHHCVIVPNTPEYVGLLNKINNYVTWGEIDKETLKMLLEKRGKLARKKSLTEGYIKEKLKLTFDQFVNEVISFKRELKDLPGLKLFFKLKPPEGGFERKGIKTQFSQGGVLGYRKEKINDLIKRML